MISTNLRKINIRELALKKEFGAFAFENAYKKLGKIREAIEKSGGVIIDVKFNTEGVRIEK